MTLEAVLTVPMRLAVTGEEEGCHLRRYAAAAMDLACGTACLVTGSTGGIGLETARCSPQREPQSSRAAGAKPPAWVSWRTWSPT